MNIDLGCLGKVVLKPVLPSTPDYEDFEIILEGRTESGISVYGVEDDSKYVIYPKVWRNTILIKV